MAILDRKAEVVVAGGGASGLMAAIFAAKRGKRVLLLEKMERTGRKLRITGKGRCNLTNIAPISEFLKHIGPDSKFLRQAFSVFFTEDLTAFMNDIGIPTVIEQGGRIFPESERAQDVVDALTDEAKRNGVEILVQSTVKHLLIENGLLKGLILSDGSKVFAEKVILAMGGASYPATGSSGDAYSLAVEAGHTIQRVSPGLVPLTTKGTLAKELQGLALKNANVSVWIDGKKSGEAFGEMLFTHFGLSGPIILSLSRRYVPMIEDGHQVFFSIDLKPALDHEKLDARLLRDINEHGKKSFQSMLRLLLPSSMIPVFISLLEIDPEKPAHQLSAADRKKIRLLLKDFRFEIIGHRGFQEAIITMGGVSTREIDPRNMSSRLLPGLYMCGEMLDLDADTGGYNLQIAFSTGMIAGTSV